MLHNDSGHDRVEIDLVMHHYLNAVIIGVGHDDVLVDAETEAVR